ncbi:MAG: precorrin-6A/cobalt-precorrin-6A reductase [Candidatus Pacebacteria bacterium]|nr:precorrin-6A/cobalt-precorrin-6A reductase [Candidatus Paceibacterota bacterium]
MRGKGVTERILVFGGTAEAHEVIGSLLKRDNPPLVILSLAGLHQPNRDIPAAVQQQSGGFGGTSGLVDYVRTNSIGLMIDATHPFAATMASHAATAANQCQIPLIKLLRPPTVIAAGLLIHRVPSLIAASHLANEWRQPIMLALGSRGSEVFLSVSSLPASAIHQPRGLTDAMTLDQQLVESGAKILILRDSGGDRAALWLVTARDQGCRVILIDRPPPPPVQIVDSVTEVLEWLVKNFYEYTPFT